MKGCMLVLKMKALPLKKKVGKQHGSLERCCREEEERDAERVTVGPHETSESDV